MTTARPGTPPRRVFNADGRLAAANYANTLTVHPNTARDQTDRRSRRPRTDVHGRGKEEAPGTGSRHLVPTMPPAAFSWSPTPSAGVLLRGSVGDRGAWTNGNDVVQGQDGACCSNVHAHIFAGHGASGRHRFRPRRRVAWREFEQRGGSQRRQHCGRMEPDNTTSPGARRNSSTEL